ncbi:hypothetical protein V865_000610 [Kwoniella europaea PYCC6329]|uniref:Secreted protein n=1 Tax=Kwoniella europaea PYCC6329 TaxID=1423913 RepID=A0AAX4K880_9TREE
MIFNSLFALLATLTVAHSLPSPSPFLEDQQEYPPEIIEVMFPDHSKYLNPDNETDTFWGPQSKHFNWDTNPALPRAAQEEFYWITYDKSVDPKELQDKDRQYNMTCYANLISWQSSGSHRTIELNTEPPYIKSLSNETWQDIVKKANVICPTGECLKKDNGCDGLEIPKWDQDYLDNYDPDTKAKSRRAVNTNLGRLGGNTASDVEDYEDDDDDEGVLD